MDDRPWPAMDLATVINRVDDGIFALDRDWQIRFANVAAARLVRLEVDDLVGSSFWAQFPTAVGSVFETRYREAMETQEADAFEAYFDALSSWFSVRVYPSTDGVTLVFQDITKPRAFRTERRALLVRLLGSEDSERARIAADVHEDSVQALGVVTLQLHRCVATSTRRRPSSSHSSRVSTRRSPGRRTAPGPAVQPGAHRPGRPDRAEHPHAGRPHLRRVADPLVRRRPGRR